MPMIAFAARRRTGGEQAARSKACTRKPLAEPGPGGSPRLATANLLLSRVRGGPAPCRRSHVHGVRRSEETLACLT
eukprot:10898620-Heterocapsa_arctica.AAC.1